MRRSHRPPCTGISYLYNAYIHDNGRRMRRSHRPPCTGGGSLTPNVSPTLPPRGGVLRTTASKRRILAVGIATAGFGLGF